MLPSSDGWEFWKWALGAAVTLVGGVIGGTWTARGTLAKVQHDILVQDLKLEAMKSECSRREEERKEEKRLFREAVCEIVQQALAQAELHHQEQIGKVTNQLGIIIALNQETSKDISEIFARLNMRVENEHRTPDRRGGNSAPVL